MLVQAQRALSNLKASIEEAAAKEEGEEQATYFKEVVKADMEALRAPIDELEPMVGKDYWPVPSYADLLFEI